MSNKSVLGFIRSMYSRAESTPTYDPKRDASAMLIDFYGDHPIPSRQSGKQSTITVYPVQIPEGANEFYFNIGTGGATNPRLTPRIIHWDDSTNGYVWDERVVPDVPVSDGEDTSCDVSSYNNGDYFLCLNFSNDTSLYRSGALNWRFGFR